MGYDIASMLLYFLPSCYGNPCAMAFVGDFLLFYYDHKLFVRGNSLQTNAMFSYHDHLILRERRGYAKGYFILVTTLND